MKHMENLHKIILPFTNKVLNCLSISTSSERSKLLHIVTNMVYLLLHFNYIFTFIT